MSGMARLAEKMLARDGRRSICARAVLALAFLTLLPALGWAQSGIAGVVRDTSGAVLPGVTVEAASPALIEKVRSVVTDDQGRYNIVDVRPGTYTVTFALAGFATVKREALELPSSFTATVNVDMRVGGIEETLTVTGEAPVVDVQNVSQQRTLSNEMLESVPTGGLPQNYATLIPGTVVSGSVNAAGLHNSYVQAEPVFRGMGESQLNYDGVTTRHMGSTAGAQYSINQGTVQEIVMVQGSTPAEQQSGGLVTNAIPKEGSNQLRGDVSFHYANESFVGNNVSDRLRALGIGSQSVREQWDFNPSVGGPIIQDKLWFFGSYRSTGAESNSGIAYDTNPTDWTYIADTSRKTASQRITDQNQSLRLTWQASRRNKFAAYFDNQPKNWYNRTISRTTAPEASHYAPYSPQYLAQGTWKLPLTNRILLEAGTSYQVTQLNMRPNDKDPTFGGQPVHAGNLLQISAVESSVNVRIRATNELGIWHRSESLRSRAAVTYVTGTHTFKVGTDVLNGDRLVDSSTIGDYTVGVTRGIPDTVTIFMKNYSKTKLNADMGLYAQDQWSMGQATVSLGLRYDYFHGSVPPQTIPANSFMPERSFGAIDTAPRWHDISPRMGVSWDLLGSGRTVVKASVNRYVNVNGGEFSTALTPRATFIPSTNRSWTDTNGNFIPDCNFTNPTTDGECGPNANLLFGQANPNAVRYDPKLLEGFGKRAYNWEGAFTLQQVVLPGLALNVGYYNRWFGNQTVTDNLRITPTDFDTFCITVPTDSRLPGGGGNQQCGYADIKDAKFGEAELFVTHLKNFGDIKERYDGVEFTVVGRLPNGAQLTGGTNTARLASNDCFLVDSPQDLLFCDVDRKFQTQLKLMGVYPLPWWGVQMSGALQLVPGQDLSVVDGRITNADIRPSLLRNLSGGSTGVILPFMQPGTAYSNYWSSLDMRFSKSFRLGSTSRITASLDAFNISNSAGVQSVTTRFGPLYGEPVVMLGARLLRLSGRFDF